MINKLKNLRKNEKLIILLSALIIAILLFFIEMRILNHEDNNYEQTKEIKQEGTNSVKNEVNDDISKFNLISSSLNLFEENKSTILLASDYQGYDKKNSVSQILSRIKDIVKPGLFVFCGDYHEDLTSNPTYSEQGIIELYNLFHKFYSEDIPMMLLQGNHDDAKTKGLIKTGLYEADNYYIYALNEDDFPNNQTATEEGDKKNIVINSADKLKVALSKIVESNSKKPIFVSAHVPLHYSNRNDGLDNVYNKYIIDVLNEYGQALDIIYLYGHNHSGDFDDYIGGSINYIGYGNEMKYNIDSSVNINFTYLNAGYIGYANNSINQTSTNVTSVSEIKINTDDITIQKYTRYGQYYTNPINIKLRNK